MRKKTIEQILEKTREALLGEVGLSDCDSYTKKIYENGVNTALDAFRVALNVNGEINSAERVKNELKRKNNALICVKIGKDGSCERGESV